MYIHGGHDIREGAKSCLWRMDIGTKVSEPSWEQLQVFNPRHSPGSIAHHTMTMVDSCAYLIGGSVLDRDSCHDYTLDVSSLTWKCFKRDTDSDAPEGIDEHSANLVEDDIIIFGGNVDGFKSAEIYKVNIHTHKWTRIIPENDRPKARAAHSASVYKDCIYIYGGKDSDGDRLNDLWCFDLTKVRIFNLK